LFAKFIVIYHFTISYTERIWCWTCSCYPAFLGLIRQDIWKIYIMAYFIRFFLVLPLQTRLWVFNCTFYEELIFFLHVEYYIIIGLILLNFYIFFETNIRMDFLHWVETNMFIFYSEMMHLCSCWCFLYRYFYVKKNFWFMYM